MPQEELLIEKWRELTPQKQQQVLEFVALLQSQPESITNKEPEFVPKTTLGKKLWQIRQKAIASGMELLTEAEIEQELATRRV